MYYSRLFLQSMIVACASVAALRVQSSPAARRTNTSTSTSDLTRERTLINESNAAREAADFATARAKAAQALASLLARPEAGQDSDWLGLLEAVARSAYHSQDELTAKSALERVLEVRTLTLPEDHPELQRARVNFALILQSLGDLTVARDLLEKVLEVDSHAFPDDHPKLQTARLNLAEAKRALGDLAGARDLERKVLEIFSRTLPDDHPDLQEARLKLAGTIQAFGDHAGARALEEKVLAVYSRALPDDHPNLQAARLDLAVTLMLIGDLSGARALLEKVLENYSRTLPDDHPDLQAVRLNLAVTFKLIGDPAGAQALLEEVLETYSRTLPDDHPNLQAARLNLAGMISDLGDHAGARALLEEVLEVYSRRLSDDHPDLQSARQNLAVTIRKLGDFAGARVLEAQVLEAYSRTLPDDHPDLQRARMNFVISLASQIARAGRSTETERARCIELLSAWCRAQAHATRTAILESSGREAEERCWRLAAWLSFPLSLASGFGGFDPQHELERESFALAETTRGAAIVATRLRPRAKASPRYGALRDVLRLASEELASLAQRGTTSEQFDRTRAEREVAERELLALARELTGGEQGGMVFDVDSLAASLADREAAVGFRRFERVGFEVAESLDYTGQPAIRATSVDSMCAFVVRNAKTSATSEVPRLTLVHLGPIDLIESAARGLREAIGVEQDRGVEVIRSELDAVRTRGDELRRFVFDPLLAALGDANRIVVALDDVLHLVPLDALPLADAPGLVGDRWRIETRATLTELTLNAPEPTGTVLVAFGGASFNQTPMGPSAEEVASIGIKEQKQVATLLRDTTWERGFTPLTHSAEEARGIATLYTEVFDGKRPALVFERRKASREALQELAPSARYLHLATHGWYARESIRSWSNPEPLDAYSGLATRWSGQEQVRGMNPMLLCGLALAGANLPENAVGRVPGLVTADEISALDLSNCELVVLSACNTNVGERRAGQGVASFQKALQMAGARSVITSLWKVPDEATKELMLDFYRRLWVEKKPKGQALWEAKQRLREAVDEHGKFLYTTRDWAAWVLTGDPD